MVDSPERPKHGLPPEEALERWSDPEAYVAMREYWDARVNVSVAPGVKLPPKVLRHQEFVRRRDPLEAALQEKLGSGELLASAMREQANPGSPRFLVDPEIIRTAFLDFEWDRIHGDPDTHVDLVHPEIFEPPGVPKNVRDIPDWYWEQFENRGIAEPRGSDREERLLSQRGNASRNTFEHEPNYRLVVISGVRFSLTVQQSKIVRLLHEAHLEGSPWRTGRQLLEAAHSESSKVSHVFRNHKEPHWKLLIASDGRGVYWLNLAENG